MGLDNPIHILFLLVVLLLVFGAKRLPEMGRGLGDGLRGFKEAMSGEAPSAQARAEANHAALASAPHVEPIVSTDAPLSAVPAGVGADQD